jgi:hypothetical protein
MYPAALINSWPDICQSADFIDFIQMPVDVSASDTESKWQTSSFGGDSD